LLCFLTLLDFSDAVAFVSPSTAGSCASLQRWRYCRHSMIAAGLPLTHQHLHVRVHVLLSVANGAAVAGGHILLLLTFRSCL
jgi:hypothetical protein